MDILESRPGIYRFISPINKIYVGQSKNIKKRYNGYRYYSGLGQTKLHRSFSKYGFENHIFEIICYCEEGELNDLEIFYGKKYDVLKNGLNIRELGIHSYTLDDLAKSKISYANAGCKNGMYGKKSWNNGMIFPEMSKQRLGDGNPFSKFSNRTYNLIYLADKNKLFERKELQKLFHVSKDWLRKKIKHIDKYGLYPSCSHEIKIIDFSPFVDEKGSLLAINNLKKDLPFRPLRSFFVFGVPKNTIRGEHSHHLTDQFAICIEGEIAITIDDGNKSIEFILSKNKGIYIPAKTWGKQVYLTGNDILFVLCSTTYFKYDYMNDYSDFIESINI